MTDNIRECDILQSYTAPFYVRVQQTSITFKCITTVYGAYRTLLTNPC